MVHIPTNLPALQIEIRRNQPSSRRLLQNDGRGKRNILSPRSVVQAQPRDKRDSKHVSRAWRPSQIVCHSFSIFLMSSALLEICVFFLVSHEWWLWVSPIVSSSPYNSFLIEATVYCFTAFKGQALISECRLDKLLYPSPLFNFTLSLAHLITSWNETHFCIIAHVKNRPYVRK